MELLAPNAGLIFFTCFTFLCLAAICFFIVNVWKRTDLDQSTKILWTILFILIPVLGIVCYLLFSRKTITSQYR
jgi:endonuclease/exonuclease/phosphatase (EEP) superfamily protein YafD